MAQKFYVEAGCTREAVDMYNQAGMWEQAHKVGTGAAVCDFCVRLIGSAVCVFCVCLIGSAVCVFCVPVSYTHLTLPTNHRV